MIHEAVGLGHMAADDRIRGTVVCSAGVFFYSRRWRKLHGGFMDSQKIVKRLSLIGILGNIVLSAFKLFAGIIGKSGAMVSDAVHSLSDVFATLIAFIGVKLSGKAADDRHPYGHDRFECIAAIILGLILVGTGFGIGYTGVKKIIGGNYDALEIPTMLPLIAAIISIVTKEAMYRYTMYYAKKLESAAFEADAWHHRSDALSSIGSFAGILAAKLGLPIMEPIASVIICLFILKVAFDILKDALMRMMDTSCGDDYEAKLKEFILRQEGVAGIDLLHTRYFGNKIYIDVEISVAKEMSLLEAHEIAENVHGQVEQNFANVKHVMIHVNPSQG